jgi:hypothetical protein
MCQSLGAGPGAARLAGRPSADMGSPLRLRMDDEDHGGGAGPGQATAARRKPLCAAELQVEPDVQSSNCWFGFGR